MVTKPEYDNRSIQQLKNEDRVRKLPSVIFGSDGIDGCEQSFFEILSNSIDEYRDGFGKVINITAFKDKSITVEDFGRGVPLDYNEKEKRYNWELVYCELYAGGKYAGSKESGSYEYALGLNGLGAASTQYASEFMEVIAYTAGTKYSVSFAKGKPVKKGKISDILSKEPCAKNKSGTVVHWRPDLEVFTDIDIPKSYYLETLKKQAVVNDGLLLHFRWENDDGTFEEYDFRYENGITDYIDELTGNLRFNNPVLYSTERKGKDRDDKKEYKLKITFAFSFDPENSKIEYYHNSSFLEHGGAPDKALRASFTSVFNKHISEGHCSLIKPKAKDTKLVFSDIEECLVFICNSFSTQTSYSNQTKKAITNKFIEKEMTDYFTVCLETFLKENPTEADKICQAVWTRKEAREHSALDRKTIIKQYTSSLKLENSVEKFVNCRSKDKDKCELFIVEGDSALTSCKLARKAEFQALIPVRGKTLNCLKASYAKIMKNDIITDLIKVIGCGIEITEKSNSKFQTFNRENLRWDKIIICTDADEDGFQIRTLILTILYRLLPSLIKEGKIYIAQTPLYEITTKDETFFAYDEKEKTAILSEIGNGKYTLQRSKGLGENTPQMMSLTTMAPETRRLLQITYEDARKTAEMFEILLGEDVTIRKKFIAEKGALYMSLADY